MVLFVEKESIFVLYLFDLQLISTQNLNVRKSIGPTKHRKGLKHRKGATKDLLNTAKYDKGLGIIP